MKQTKATVKAIATGIVATCMTSAGALAGSVTQPGETAGLSLGAPFPQGFYFENTGSVGGTRGLDKSSEAVDIPVLAWSTPWTILNGRVEAYVAAPALTVGLPVASGGLHDYALWYNPFMTVGLAWDLGNGWGFSNWVGGYAPVDTVVGQNFWTFNERAALSYTTGTWTFSAHMIYGVTGTDENTGRKVGPDYLNVDFAAVKTFGKWQFGLVGFGSGDQSGIDTNPAYKKQSQFALGGLVGYNFTGISTQLYVTQDVYTKNYGDVEDTRIWGRVVVPLGDIESHPASYK